jgi:hypothetical protein
MGLGALGKCRRTSEAISFQALMTRTGRHMVAESRLGTNDECAYIPCNHSGVIDSEVVKWTDHYECNEL